jgi:hypothetical protein
VPSGGNGIGWIGATEGGANEHTVIAQIGGTSMLLVQSGCISPSTH